MRENEAHYSWRGGRQVSVFMLLVSAPRGGGKIWEGRGGEALKPTATLNNKTAKLTLDEWEWAGGGGGRGW